jgi:hypothetical protein
MSKDNGGPAFGELQQVGDVAMRDGGLSIRDYFAAHASEEDIARVLEYNMITRQQARYMHADSMLLERAK